jgi:vacuolar iron transporter family protein
MPDKEIHRIHRTGWLRASVMGANDGIVSTASLVMGVAAAGTDSHFILVTGVAGLVAGAMSMAAGEYVSVSSQSDIEQADLERERKELVNNPVREHRELTDIYVDRGLDRGLAIDVATALTEHDALAAHRRDELGISDAMSARPIQAALTSAATFAIGALLPLLLVVVVPIQHLMWAVSASSLIFLAGLGALSAWAGGAPRLVATVRVTFWGACAMGLTSAVGLLFNISG